MLRSAVLRSAAADGGGANGLRNRDLPAAGAAAGSAVGSAAACAGAGAKSTVCAKATEGGVWHLGRSSAAGAGADAAGGITAAAGDTAAIAAAATEAAAAAHAAKPPAGAAGPSAVAAACDTVSSPHSMRSTAEVGA